MCELGKIEITLLIGGVICLIVHLGFEIQRIKHEKKVSEWAKK